MNLSLYSAATGMEAQQKNLDVISNNIANVNTPGYKCLDLSPNFQVQFEQAMQHLKTGQAIQQKPKATLEVSHDSKLITRQDGNN